MTADYFDAKKTGAGRGRIDIEVRVKADNVESFANEIKQATIDRVLEVIEKAEYNVRPEAQLETIRRNVIGMKVNEGGGSRMQRVVMPTCPYCHKTMAWMQAEKDHPLNRLKKDGDTVLVSCPRCKERYYVSQRKRYIGRKNL